MTTLQKIIKYLALAFALFLIVSILGGILGAVGLLGSFFSEDEVLDEDAVLQNTTTYSVNGEIHDLDIRINAAEVLIKEGTSFSVESNLKHLKVEEKGGLLTIEETKKFTGTYNGAVLTVYVPAGTVFDEVDLVTGAGKLTVDALRSKTLSFELGAGDVCIDSLVAMEDADIEGGAGRITISSGALKDLDLDMGVGQLNLTSALTGDCQLDLGVGESNLTLVGSKEDYKLDLEKGIGNITVDGKNVSYYGSSGNGANQVEINGGIGAIHIGFAKD